MMPARMRDRAQPIVQTQVSKIAQCAMVSLTLLPALYLSLASLFDCRSLSLSLSTNPRLRTDIDVWRLFALICVCSQL